MNTIISNRKFSIYKHILNLDKKNIIQRIILKIEF